MTKTTAKRLLWLKNKLRAVKFDALKIAQSTNDDIIANNMTWLAASIETTIDELSEDFDKAQSKFPNQPTDE